MVELAHVRWAMTLLWGPLFHSVLGIRSGSRSHFPSKHQTKPNFLHTTTKHTVTMSGSPPPEEREKADAEARAKEQAEQAALPYKWEQTIKDLDITITVDAKYKGKDLDINIARNSIKAGIKGQEPILQVRYSKSVSSDSLG